MTNTDRIEKQILLKATRARVWKALTDAEEFGQWFRAKLEGSFVVGQAIKGHITYPGYEHLKMELWIEKMEEEKLFTLRWHPHAVDEKVDYSVEPTTLVEFRLEDAPDGTLLTIVESGFDRIPSSRREQAFRMNSEGWAEQLENIRRYVS